jgi:UDP-N-acetylglucosamine enolpyruvyl transferase
MTRPMMRVIDPLRTMGASIDCSENGTLPITIKGGVQIKGIDYDVIGGNVYNCGTNDGARTHFIFYLALFK